MTRVVTLLSVVVSVAVLFVFGYSAPAKFGSWPAAPWQEAVSDDTWIMLLVFAAIFMFYSVLLTRRTFASVWFVAFAASALPLLAALYPCAHRLDVARHADDYLDGDFVYEIVITERVFLIGLALSAILAGIAMFGYFKRQKC